MYPDLADLTHVTEADFFPAIAGVRRFVDPVPLRRGDISEWRLAHADNDDIRVRRCNRNGTDSSGSEVVI